MFNFSCSLILLSFSFPPLLLVDVSVMKIVSKCVRIDKLVLSHAAGHIKLLFMFFIVGLWIIIFIAVVEYAICVWWVLLHIRSDLMFQLCLFDWKRYFSRYRFALVPRVNSNQNWQQGRCVLGCERLIACNYRLIACNSLQNKKLVVN